jgi:hypothetical protein
MERRDPEEPIADATGTDRPDDAPAMPPSKELTDGQDEATGDERTAVEGLSGIAATHRAFGGGTPSAAGGIGTHVPTDEDDHDLEPDIEPGEASTDSTDPRGH